MSVNESRKLIVHGDEIYIVIGSPLTGYYAEKVLTTELLGKWDRSWKAVRACAVDAGVEPEGDAA